MSNSSPSLKKISVLVSTGRNPISGVARYASNDAISLSLGLKLAETLSAKVDVLSATDALKTDIAALTDYLALGAEEVKVVSTMVGENFISSLIESLSSLKPDLILTGSRAENGEDSGLLPYVIAEKLGLPIIANALEISNVGENLEILQFLPKGKRRRVIISLPAVVVVHPLAPVKLHYAAAKKTTGVITMLPATGVSSLLNQPQCQILSLNPAKNHKPLKLKVKDGQYEAKKTGHERLMASITSEVKGGAVVIDKSSVEKAQVILRYLREHHLINF